MFKVPNELIELSSLFKQSPLYIVGGWVRDFLLKKDMPQKQDIDITSSLDIEKIKDDLQSKGFSLSVKNAKFGTYVVSKNNFEFEYTRLRTETYKIAGKHSPDKVVFVDNIKIDAKRRDFTINSLYYQIDNNMLFDFYNGFSDIKNKIIRCIETPEYVFENDAIRILRLVRFACVLDFKIDLDTLQAAQKNIHKLALISDEWKQREIDRIFIDKNKKLSNPKARKRAYKIFTDIGALPYLLPQLDKYSDK